MSNTPVATGIAGQATATGDSTALLVGIVNTVIKEMNARAHGRGSMLDDRGNVRTIIQVLLDRDARGET